MPRTMGLVVHNTLTRRKEPFHKAPGEQVGMYVCGPTVQDEPHLGHVRANVSFDVIRRTFLALGYPVLYVMNITDVDDKIIARANSEGRTAWEVAEQYSRVFDSTMQKLGVLPADITPRATGHIAEMVSLIEDLVTREAAYPVEGGDVYFAVEKFDGYVKLSHRSLDDMRAGERVEPDPRKRHPMDFALWKAAKPGEPSWPSPWGAGRPGWHIECSAMSMKYLGPTFDVHGGGMDLIFPHHENEIAQTEASTNVRFVSVWLHNGFVTLNKEKMSKSQKHYVSAADVLRDYAAPVVRYFVISGHYRSQIDFSVEALEDARGAWTRFVGFARNAQATLGAATLPAPADDSPWRAKFLDAMSDDFATPEALAVLFELMNEANATMEKVERGADPSELATLVATFSECAGVLGLDPIRQWPERSSASVAPLVEYLLADRDAARNEKDYARADRIRTLLAESGIVVEDRPSGARWYIGGST
ncbi:MAG: cysteine--tRNA ligase [Actinomycetota bacterium]